MEERHVRVINKSSFGLPWWRPKIIGATMPQVQPDNYKDTITNTSTCTTLHIATYRRSETKNRRMIWHCDSFITLCQQWNKGHFK